LLEWLEEDIKKWGFFVFFVALSFFFQPLPFLSHYFFGVQPF